MYEYYIRFFDELDNFVYDCKVKAASFTGAEIYAMAQLNGRKAADYVVIRIA